MEVIIRKRAELLVNNSIKVILVCVMVVIVSVEMTSASLGLHPNQIAIWLAIPSRLKLAVDFGGKVSMQSTQVLNYRTF